MTAIIKREKRQADPRNLEEVDEGFGIESSGSMLMGLKANNITIQDPAEVPRVPIRPKRRLNVLISIILGIFGGIGLIFFLEYLDDTNTEKKRRIF